MLMFRIKEVSICLRLYDCCMRRLTSLEQVLPLKKKSPFWSDLGLARKIYQKRALMTLPSQSADDLESALPQVVEAPVEDEQEIVFDSTRGQSVTGKESDVVDKV